ncbi:hypothetical protein EON79_19180 [bacterium]|nr:MAG: hypothetical protein EON79_19180 [bacterium]
MKLNPILVRLVAVATVATTVAAPIAQAQSLNDLGKLIDRRQSKKNEWRNIAIGAGALGVLGLLKKDNTLTFAGFGGALYSLTRYEADRKSQSKLQRARASYFQRGSFTRNGQRYTRRTVRKNGKTYYQFVKAR